MKWQAELERLYTSYLSGTDLYSPEVSNKITKITEKMKNKFPGKYRIEECYSHRHRQFHLRLVFDTPQEELMWLMRYSDD